jgi:hypothetical protein
MQDFQTVISNKFYELRPLFAPSPTATFDELIKQDVFCKLMILDRTASNPDAFQAGYTIWEFECNRDINKFLDQFTLKIVDGNVCVELRPIDDSTTANH